MTSPHLAAARQADAAGRYDDAINELALGTQGGDVHCTRELGYRLFLGDRAPLLPAEGLQFLGEACDGGVPEAAARAAALLALGVRVPPNWPLALRWLGRSAQGGWEPARQQLLVLCDDRALAGRTAATLAADPVARIDWQQVAAGVRLDDWRRSPPAQVRSADPRVVAFSGFVRPEICAYLVSLAPGRLEPARVYDPVARADIVAPHRNNTLATFDVACVEFAHVLVQSRMAAACGVPATHLEAPSVLHYWPGEEIQNHFDFVDPKSVTDYAAEIARNGQRMITFLLYLNDDYDGGETDFPSLGFAHKGRCGDALFFTNALGDFSPDLRMVHAGRPTTRGEKWIITQFVRSRPTR